MYTSGHFSHANDAFINYAGTTDHLFNANGSVLKNLPLKKRFSRRASSSLSISTSSNSSSNHNNNDPRTNEFSSFNLHCLSKFDRQIFELNQGSVFTQDPLMADEAGAKSKETLPSKNNGSVIVKGEIDAPLVHATSDITHLNPLNLLGPLNKSTHECSESRHPANFHHQMTHAYGKSRPSIPEN